MRIAARYQENGTLVATRIWASAQFNSVWLSPEGHVLHVDTANDVVTVASESGGGVDLIVDANTQFFFRQPQDAAGNPANTIVRSTSLVLKGNELAVRNQLPIAYLLRTKTSTMRTACSVERASDVCGSVTLSTTPPKT